MEVEDSERSRLIGLARRALGRKGPDAGRLTKLAGDLFARVGLEDLAVYGADDLAAFVRSADSLLARRMPGETIVRIADPVPADSGTPGGDVTVVEALNDNMPFLVDSTLGELHAFGVEVRLVAHPIVSVARDGKGRLVAYHGTGPAPAGDLRESLIQVHIARLEGAERRTLLAERLEGLCAEIRRAVAGWRPMLDRLRSAIAEYRAHLPPIPEADRDEAVAFLEWLADDNFTFLGARDYRYTGAKRGELRSAATGGLGILADPSVRVLRRGARGVAATPAIREFLMRPEPLIVTKANFVSRIHRRAYADYVGVKLYSRRGRLAGEVTFVGLFTSTAYTRSVRAIPFLRRKAEAIMARAGFDPASHSGKALANVLETFPRDELFQIDEDTLFDFALSIMALDERPRVRVLVRRDRYDRFVSAVVYVPRDRYDSRVRVAIGDYLARVFDGHVSAFYPSFPEGTLTRVQFIIGRAGGKTPNPDQASLEAAVVEIVTNWEDDLADAIRGAFVPDEADRLIAAWRGAFPAGYRDATTPEAAVGDIRTIEGVTAVRPIAGAFLPSARERPQAVALKLMHLGEPISLSSRVPMLEAMGLRVIDEQTYEVKPAGRAVIFIHDMALERADGQPLDLREAAPALLACFMAVWFGEAESDGYNALVLTASLPWRDAALIRAISRYIRQAGTPLSQHYMWETLNRYAAITRTLADVFHSRFDPDGVDETHARRGIARIETALEAVESLDEDRIIRRFLNVVDAIVRTNFFQARPDGGPFPEIVFKLDPQRIEELPAPRPFREIFVYSPRVEAVHLRFGPVARGGIRWSDRPLDFRTEVLGLAKAQQVKNAVIVPVGAKGGFVPKRPTPVGDRAAAAEEGKAAYGIFIDRLLDITDNLVGDRIVPPARVVRRDSDDPYLVVAADKGTATFSDAANAIAEAHGFWLGDAFASGGSHGFDHKKMGITARGAWEAVKRHFREMDVDIETTPFTVIGVGDMSGDVFGNAMLLSPAIRLVAAFDHRDIFIDPDPDPAIGLAERRRLFDLPRSSWQDYERTRISKGGGVFSRRDKSIPLSAETKALLGLFADKATPNDVLRAILKARADLLFFGGIGTFVRAADESDERVGDRTNDAVRITGRELRVRVVGEGANLAMTQRGRIEYCLAGGRCNSDAIDNSAGVNTSDVEVNIKIALGRAVREGRLDFKRRNRLLVAMTDEVAGLVLRNNYLQTLAISLAQSRGFEYFGFQRRFMQDLERRGILDRKLEALPDDAEMAERQKAGKPLTRPELGILLGYAKIALKVELLAGRVADDTTLDNELVRYFPARMRRPHAEDIEAHPLRAEIIATMIANSMINRGGPTYVTRVSDRTGAGPVDIARACVTARDAFGLRALNDAIDALDNRVPGTKQLELYRAVEDLLTAKTVWFLRNASFEAGIGPLVEAYGATVAALAGMLVEVLPARFTEILQESADKFAAVGVPADLAATIANLPILSTATDIHLVVEATGAKLAEAASVFFAVAEEFRVARIARLAQGLPVADYYDGLARDRALETLAIALRRIASEAILAGGIPKWRERHKAAVERALGAVSGLTEGEMTLSRITVTAERLAELGRAGSRPAPGNALA